MYIFEWICVSYNRNFIDIYYALLYSIYKYQLINSFIINNYIIIIYLSLYISTPGFPSISLAYLLKFIHKKTLAFDFVLIWIKYTIILQFYYNINIYISKDFAYSIWTLKHTLNPWIKTHMSSSQNEYDDTSNLLQNGPRQFYFIFSEKYY